MRSSSYHSGSVMWVLSDLTLGDILIGLNDFFACMRCPGQRGQFAVSYAQNAFEIVELEGHAREVVHQTRKSRDERTAPVRRSSAASCRAAHFGRWAEQSLHRRGTLIRRFSSIFRLQETVLFSYRKSRILNPYAGLENSHTKRPSILSLREIFC